ncbi:hypothetical protein X777_10220 [Ooceraea biroi]|uniref:Uncharacterized protein n=1 Tax=Ooceraea biroi TaxID=2015173 RepID=A0A026X2S2_OOCBI|nr:hypothetical protein X777_10220 [Ooceraea biroi]
MEEVDGRDDAVNEYKREEEARCETRTEDKERENERRDTEKKRERERIWRQIFRSQDSKSDGEGREMVALRTIRPYYTASLLGMYVARIRCMQPKFNQDC